MKYAVEAALGRARNGGITYPQFASAPRRITYRGADAARRTPNASPNH